MKKCLIHLINYEIFEKISYTLFHIAMILVYSNHREFSPIPLIISLILALAFIKLNKTIHYTIKHDFSI